VSTSVREYGSKCVMCFGLRDLMCFGLRDVMRKKDNMLLGMNLCTDIFTLLTHTIDFHIIKIKKSILKSIFIIFFKIQKIYFTKILNIQLILNIII